MIKERKFQVHPNVLSCLMHLRLRAELDQMRDGKRGRKPRSIGRMGGGKPGDDDDKPKFKSDIRKKWQTKNQKKREKEMKEVRKEQAEAEAEVDQEERAQVVSLKFSVSYGPEIDDLANGNAEKSVCAVLLHLEASRQITTLAIRFGGYQPIRPLHQRRFLPGSLGRPSPAHCEPGRD